MSPVGTLVPFYLPGRNQSARASRVWPLGSKPLGDEARHAKRGRGMRPVLPICDSLAEVAAQQALEGLAVAGLVLKLPCQNRRMLYITIFIYQPRVDIANPFPHFSHQKSCCGKNSIDVLLSTS